MPIFGGPGKPRFDFSGRGSHLTGGTQGGGFYVAMMNAETVNAIVASVGRQMKTATNSQIRDAAKDIAARVVKPALDTAKMEATPRIAKHMEVRARRDRLVGVQIGSVNPKGLKGFRANKSESKGGRTTLAWGSELGPRGGRRSGGRPGSRPPRGVNHYGVPRRRGGYWVQPTVQKVIPQVVKEYNEAIYEIWQWAIRSKPRSRFGRAA